MGTGTNIACKDELTLAGTLKDVRFCWFRTLAGIVFSSDVHSIGHCWNELCENNGFCGGCLHRGLLHTGAVDRHTICNVVGVDTSIVVFRLCPGQSY